MSEDFRAVAIAFDLSLDYHRRMARGFRRGIDATGSGREVVLVEGPPFAFRRSFDGVVVRLTADQSERSLRSVGQTPLVRLHAKVRYPRGPTVIADPHACGRLVAEHLIECGFRRLAIMAAAKTWELHAFGRSLQRAADAAGVQSVVMQRDQLSTWLRAQREPVGIAVGWDVEAAAVVRSALRLGRAVPEEVGVVGLGNDSLRCDLADVPLSSLDTAPEMLGEHAAGLLVDLMAGRKPPEEPLLVRPRGVVVRRSSAVVAGDDPLLERVLAYIREHACEGMHVSELGPIIDVSRRTVEIRFKRRFGRTLHAEIRRVQFLNAQRLLTETDLAITEVAVRSGFRDPVRFADLFRKAFAMPPRDWRRAYRTRSRSN